MRKILIDNYGSLEVPSHAAERIEDNTPQSHFLSSHWADIVKETSALDTLLANKFKRKKIERVWDMMAGCGFSATVFRHYFPGASLHLNDLSEECAEILRKNFPEAIVTQEDVRALSPYDIDLAFIDFNRFTINSVSDWEILLETVSADSRRILLTDSACYGFRFGNLSRYGCSKPEEYYERLQETLSFTGKSISTVIDFGNAALILLEKKKGAIEFLPISRKLHIRKDEGFGL